MAKRSIRKIKSRVKIIRELKKKEGIRDLPSGKNFSESDMGNVAGASHSVNLGRRVASVPSPQAQTGAVRQQVQQSISSQGPLYEVGKSMGGSGGEGGRVYKTSEDLQTDKIQEASIGGGFASSRPVSVLPEDRMVQQTERRIRSDAEKGRDYESSGMKGGGGKGRRRYPWEV